MFLIFISLLIISVVQMNPKYSSLIDTKPCEKNIISSNKHITTKNICRENKTRIKQVHIVNGRDEIEHYEYIYPIIPSWLMYCIIVLTSFLLIAFNICIWYI